MRPPSERENVTSPLVVAPPLEFDVPSDEQPAGRCPYCNRPFRAADTLALHVGQHHPDACTPDEHDAYEEARKAESDELFVYHLKVVAALVLVFMAFSYAYAFAWS